MSQEQFTKNHYYRHKSKDDCIEPANKYWNRLDSDRKASVMRAWLKYLEEEKQVESAEKVMSQPDGLFFQNALKDLQYYRYLCATSLFFLCQVLEKYNQTTYRTHSEITDSFLIQKEPTIANFETFANQYSGLKESILLTPRGSFKSSINLADCAQWVINYPEITIAIITGVYQLAVDFVGELKGHFTLEESGLVDADKNPIYVPKKLQNRETGEWSTSAFQSLFMEHCTGPKEGRAAEWQTSAGGNDKEPTCRAASIEATLSGWHYGVLVFDDIITNENSLTPTRLEAVNKQASINEAMLNPFGFKSVVGTWYDQNDYYGIKIDQEEKLAKEDGLEGTIKGSVDSGRFNSHAYTKIFLRACWWLTPEAISLGKIEEELTKNDLELFFPERLDYEWLKKKQKTDPYFAIKYLNNPRLHHQVKFPRELLIRRTIPHNQLPQQGIVVSTVDTAYSVQNWADYTVMITALIYGGRFYIINMIRGRFNEFELPQVIAAGAFKWKPKRIAIEDSVGVKWMGRELRREMDKLRITVPVEFVSLGYGSKLNSKKMKAKPVARLLGDERMFFLNSCEGLQDIYTELEKFTGTADDSNDDIVSALSLLAEVFQPYADMESKINFTSTQFVADRQAEERYNQVYCLGKYAKTKDNYVDDNPATLWEMEQAFKQGVSNTDNYGNPLEDVLS